MASDILIVDDEADIRELVSGILMDEGHGTRTAADADSALAEVARRRPSLVFLDIWLQGSRMDGLAILDAMKREHADLPVIMISGHGNIETAVSAIKRGAYDYIEKPLKMDRLLVITERALEASKLRREVKVLRERAGDAGELVGVSPAMNHLRQLIEKVAPTNSRIMISGPSGSGKEMVARVIHELSARSGGPCGVHIHHEALPVGWAEITGIWVRCLGVGDQGQDRRRAAANSIRRSSRQARRDARSACVS